MAAALGREQDMIPLRQLRILSDLERGRIRLGRRYQQIAKPFEWKFTRRDLDRVLARLDTAAYNRAA